MALPGSFSGRRPSTRGAIRWPAAACNHAAVTYSSTKMKKAATHIVSVDPTFAEIVESSPLCTIGKGARTTLTPFHSLVVSVIAQQVSVKAADSITQKLHDHLGGEVTAGRLVEAPEGELRAVGLSGAKTKTIKGLAHAIHTGALDLEKALTHPDDSAVVAELTKLWGIGRWTAEMFLMFTMHRLDVWPTGDLAMRKGWNIVYGKTGDIDPKILEPLGDPLRLPKRCLLVLLASHRRRQFKLVTRCESNRGTRKSPLPPKHPQRWKAHQKTPSPGPGSGPALPPPRFR